MQWTAWTRLSIIGQSLRVYTFVRILYYGFAHKLRLYRNRIVITELQWWHYFLALWEILSLPCQDWSSADNSTPQVQACTTWFCLLSKTNLWEACPFRLCICMTGTSCLSKVGVACKNDMKLKSRNWLLQSQLGSSDRQIVEHEINAWVRNTLVHLSKNINVFKMQFLTTVG